MIRSLFALIAFGLAACETVPPTFDPVLFAAQVDAIESNPSTWAVDQELTTLLSREDLTIEQRASGLFIRAKRRFEGKYNVPGAIEDYTAFATLLPEDPRNAMAERHKVFAATEIENAQRRLAQLQTLSAWFDDKVLMGDLEAGAARYKASGLTPTDHQTYLLKEAGYICIGEVSGEPVHRFGEVPTYAENAVWCAAPSVS